MGSAHLDQAAPPIKEETPKSRSYRAFYFLSREIDIKATTHNHEDRSWRAPIWSSIQNGLNVLHKLKTFIVSIASRVSVLHQSTIAALTGFSCNQTPSSNQDTSTRSPSPTPPRCVNKRGLRTLQQLLGLPPDPYPLSRPPRHNGKGSHADSRRAGRRGWACKSEDCWYFNFAKGVSCRRRGVEQVQRDGFEAALSNFAEHGNLLFSRDSQEPELIDLAAPFLGSDLTCSSKGSGHFDFAKNVSRGQCDAEKVQEDGLEAALSTFTGT